MTLVRGALKKITTDFSIKNWVYMLFYGLTSNFMAKKGWGAWFFFFLRSEGGGGRKTLAINIFASPPPKVFVNGPLCAENVQVQYFIYSIAQKVFSIAVILSPWTFARLDLYYTLTILWSNIISVKSVGLLGVYMKLSSKETWG